MTDTPDAAEPAEASLEPEAAGQPDPGPDHPARRATKFMADLSRAMQAAAEHARSETMTRFEVEAKGVVEQVQAMATDEAADLRRQADDDIAAIREWSKAEIARLRETTESRITARKAGLDGEMERHAATVQARIDQVAAMAAAFEAQMAGFFERLNAEEDPTRIATMAETMPDPPSLTDVAASVAMIAAAPEPAPLASPGSSESVDFAAAEAEAASFSEDLTGNEPADAGAVMLGDRSPTPSPAVDPVAGSSATNALSTHRLIVSGLASVANIANFKRSLAGIPGVATIGVASGPDGDFVFTISHTLETTIAAAVEGLPGFDVQITGASDDAINVAAQDHDTPA